MPLTPMHLGLNPYPNPGNDGHPVLSPMDESPAYRLLKQMRSIAIMGVVAASTITVIGAGMIASAHAALHNPDTAIGAVLTVYGLDGLRRFIPRLKQTNQRLQAMTSDGP